MTYKELAQHLLSLPEDKQAQTVTVYDPVQDEYHAAKVVEVDDSQNVLDVGHLVITFW